MAVENATPGFQGQSILAVANATGKNAPKTNVARSALEDTAEHRRMLKTVYDLYGEHVSKEIGRLASSESYSLSRAVSFAPFIASPLTNSNVPPSKPDMLKEALANIPLILVEGKDERSNISLNELSAYEEFTTIESPLHRSIESFVKEAPSDVTTNKLLNVLGNAGAQQDSSLVLCNIHAPYVEEHVRSIFDIAEVRASIESRALIMTWRKRTEPSRWLSSSEVFYDLLKEDVHFYHQVSEARDRGRNQGSRYDHVNSGLNVPLSGVITQNLEGYGSFIANRERFITPGTGLVRYFSELNKDQSDDRLKVLAVSFALLEMLRGMSLPWDIINSELFERAASSPGFGALKRYVDKDRFVAALQESSASTFDSYAWERRGEGFAM